MEFDKIHFELTEFLQPRRKWPCDWVERRLWSTPEPLHVLCARVCDYLPEEPCFKWTNMDVLQWIEALGFPEYRNTLYVNMLNGRTLLLLDATALCLMNIKDFDNITTITKAIRDLYRVELVLFKRSISLPPRYPDTHFKFFRVQTGPTYQNITRSELFRRMHLLQDIPPHRNHWRTLHDYLQHIPVNQEHRIGYAPKHKLYHVPIDPRPARRYSSTIARSDIECQCIPPCECGWTENSYRPPWILSCLTEALAEQLRDGDLIVAAVDQSGGQPIEASGKQPNDDGDDSDGVVLMAADADQPPTGEPMEGDGLPCTCLYPHSCHVQAPVVLTIIRCFEEHIAQHYTSSDLNST